jgi:uncharacterized protein (DUF1697 family)
VSRPPRAARGAGSSPRASTDSHERSARRYIAFLRAINVGGHVVKMSELRTLFASMGFASVETVIASGNVVFESSETSSDTEARIATTLEASLGYAVATFVRTASEVAAVAKYRAFPDIDADATGAATYIGFLHAPPAPDAVRDLAAFESDIDSLHVHGREVYWLCRTRMGESAFSGARLERVLRMPTTMRNVTTVRRIAAKYATSP